MFVVHKLGRKIEIRHYCNFDTQ